MSDPGGVVTATRTGFVAPLVWHHGEDRQTIARELTAVADAGMTSFVLEPRPHPDYLGAGWWTDLATVVEIARGLGLRFWLFDDGRFPSGHAGGLVPTRHPELLKRFLTQRHLDVTGPLPAASFDVGAWIVDDESLVAVVAGRRATDDDLDEWSLVDLTEDVDDGVLRWPVPDGRWRVFIIVETPHGGESDTRDYLNPVDPRSARAYLDLVHEPHLARFRADFGNTILGFFQDEPRLGNLPSYEARLGAASMAYPYQTPAGPTGNHEATLPFSTALMSRFLTSPEVKGRAVLPLLWFSGGGPVTARARYAFMDVTSRLFADYLAELGAWCRTNDVDLIGHLVEDNGAHARLGYGPGHYFRAIRSQTVPGVDVVGQIYPGETEGRSASPFGYLDNGFFYWGLAKLASSAAHVNPGTGGIALCEAFGAYGWQLGLPLMKWLTDHLCVRGINFFVPHAFSPRVFDPDCPPHFFNGGLNPQWPYFALWVDYAQRLCAALAGGQHVAPAAVLYHADAEWVGEAMGFEQVVRVLSEDQLDADVVSADDLAAATVDDGVLRLGTEGYHALVVPGSQRVMAHVATLLEDLHGRGLPVVVAGERPVVVGSGLELEVPAVELDDIATHLRRAGVPAVSATPRSPALRIYHYLKSGVHTYFCVNESTDTSLQTGLRLPLRGEVSAVDLLSHTERLLGSEPSADGCRVRLTLAPTESVLLRIDPRPRAATPEPAPLVETRPLDTAQLSWTLSTRPWQAADAPADHRDIGQLADVSELTEFARYAGSFCYETRFDLADVPDRLVLDLGAVHEIAEVTVNGSALGARICPPYIFEIRLDQLRKGENTLSITVVTSLARAAGSTRFDRGRPRPPVGLRGPLRLTAEYDNKEVVA